MIDIESNGLDSFKNCISCICVVNIDSNVNYSFFGNNERLLLEQFFSFLNNDSLVFIGFNSDSFDIPFILKRALINDIVIPKCFLCAKRIDLRKIVNSFFISFNKYDKGSLRDWALILGVSCVSEDGSKMIEFFDNNDFDSIKSHCLEDCDITLRLYNRCVRVGFIGSL